MFSSISYAEKYICSYLFDKESRSFVLERKSNQLFAEISVGGVIITRVLLENEKYLILGMLKKYGGFSGYEVTFIDKSIKTFQSSTIFEPKYKGGKSAVISGNCLIN